MNVLQAIQQGIVELNTHSNMPLSELQRDGQRQFHSLFVFENYPSPVETTGDDAGIESSMRFRQAIEKTDYPLSVVAYEQGESLVVYLKYGQDWLSGARANELLDQLMQILACISVTPNIPHQQISLLEPE